MTITDLLRRMHADFRERLAAIESISRAGGPAEAAKIGHELSLLLPVLRAHEEVEETLLYPALRGLDPALTPETPDSVLSHDALRERVAELELALRRPEASLSLLWAAESFILAFLRHMAREESALFKEAERLLPRETLERLGDQALARVPAGSAI